MWIGRAVHQNRKQDSPHPHAPAIAAVMEAAGIEFVSGERGEGIRSRPTAPPEAARAEARRSVSRQLQAHQIRVVLADVADAHGHRPCLHQFGGIRCSAAWDLLAAVIDGHGMGCFGKEQPALDQHSGQLNRRG